MTTPTPPPGRPEDTETTTQEGTIDPVVGEPVDHPTRDDVPPPAADAAPVGTDERTSEASAGAHAAPRPVPPSGREAPSDDVVVEDLRTGAAPLPATEHRTDPATTGTPSSGTAAAGAAAAAAADAQRAEDRRAHEERLQAEHRREEHEERRDADDEPARRRDRRPRTDPDEVPEPPRRPGFGRHVLGVVVGLLLTPFAFLLTGIGAARLADIAGTARMGTDALGVTLLVVGVALLAAIALLGAWSPATPITGGLVWGLALGTAYLVAPATVERAVDEAARGQTPPAAVDQFAQSAMSGMLLVVGVLLLAAGLAAAFARRAGRRYAQEVAAVELARLDAERRAPAA